ARNETKLLPGFVTFAYPTIVSSSKKSSGEWSQCGQDAGREPLVGEELVHAHAGEPDHAQRERGRDRLLPRGDLLDADAVVLVAKRLGGRGRGGCAKPGARIGGPRALFPSDGSSRSLLVSFPASSRPPLDPLAEVVGGAVQPDPLLSSGVAIADRD